MHKLDKCIFTTLVWRIDPALFGWDVGQIALFPQDVLSSQGEHVYMLIRGAFTHLLIAWPILSGSRSVPFSRSFEAISATALIKL